MRNLTDHSLSADYRRLKNGYNRFQRDNTKYCDMFLIIT